MSDTGYLTRLDAPRGVRDLLPPRSNLVWAATVYFGELARLYGYEPIETPTFEHTAVFERSVGEATDIVTKQMYTFSDKSGASLTLRPEGTAGVVRAFVQHEIYKSTPLPWRVFYVEDMFRYERPQAGRYRQFKQVGVEAIGARDPQSDAEQIELCWRFLEAVGVGALEVRLNSLGDPSCRPRFVTELSSYLADAKVYSALCSDCKLRAEKNPMRVFDCKEESCRRVLAAAPTIEEFLCEECREHFAQLKECLEVLGIPFKVQPELVRGLDYYTRTAFEIVSSALDAAQNAVAGGGRYDGLVEVLGGPPTPGVGFAIGVERALLAAEALDSDLSRRSVKDETTVTVQGRGQTALVPFDAKPDAVVVPLIKPALSVSVKLASELRKMGYVAFTQESGRSLRSQLRAADKAGAQLVALVGEEELAEGAVTIKPLRLAGGGGEPPQSRLPLDEAPTYIDGLLQAGGTRQ
jgi:histidyl-tRNA synthetase